MRLGEKKSPKVTEKKGSKPNDAEMKLSDLIESNLMGLNDDNSIFKDFTEPDLMKTGYLIPLKCGHNGQLG